MSFNVGLAGLAMSTPNGSQGPPMRLEPSPGTSQYGKPSSDVTCAWRGSLSEYVLPYRLLCSNTQYI